MERWFLMPCNGDESLSSREHGWVGLLSRAGVLGMFFLFTATVSLGADQPLSVTSTSSTQAQETQELVARGLAALAAGRLEEAQGVLEQAAAAAPNSEVAWLGLAEAAERSGRPVEALRYARQAVKVSPGSTTALGRLGLIQAGLGSVTDSLESFSRLRALAPKAASAYLVPALLLRDAQERDRALALLEEGIEQGVVDPGLESQLTLSLLSSGRTAEAVTTARAALAHHPEAGSVRLALGVALAASAVGEEGDALRQEALGLLRSALSAEVEEPGRVHLELASLYEELDQPEESLKALRAAAEALPGVAEVHYRLAGALRKAGDAEGAREELELFQRLSRRSEEAELRSKQVGIALNEAQELALENRLSEALEKVETVLADKKDDPRALNLRAKLLFSMRRAKEALASVAAAQKVAPSGVEAYYLEGLFRFHMAELPASAKALLQAVALDERLADAHRLLGMIASREERSEEAIVFFERAIELGAGDAALRLGYASVLSDVGREDESQQQIAIYEKMAKP